MTIKTDRPVSIRDLDAETSAILQAAKDQILLVMTALQGGKCRIPCDLLDDFPVGRGLSMKIEGRDLVFELIEGPNTKVDWPSR